MRQIFCDSRDRVRGSPCDFSIQLARTLTTSDRPHRYRVDSLRLPVAVPTITHLNNTFKVRLGSSDYLITLPSRQYDTASICSTLQGLLAGAAPGTWTVTYDTATISMTISCSNPFTVVGGTFASQLMSRPYTTTSTSIRFSYVPLNGADVIFLCSSQFASIDHHGPNGAHDVILPCNITAPFGSVQEFSSTIPDWVECPSFTTNQLSFQLRDRDHNLLSDYVPNISFLLTID